MFLRQEISSEDNDRHKSRCAGLPIAPASLSPASPSAEMLNIQEASPLILPQILTIFLPVYLCFKLYTRCSNRLAHFKVLPMLITATITTLSSPNSNGPFSSCKHRTQKDDFIDICTLPFIVNGSIWDVSFKLI